MQHLKNKERELYRAFKLYSRKVLSIIKDIIFKIISFLKKEYSLLIVSHSGDKTKAINLNMLVILSTILLFTTSVGSFIFLQGRIEFLSLEAKKHNIAIAEIRKDYSELNDKVSYLLKISKPYQAISSNLLGRFGYVDTWPKDLGFFEPVQDISTFTTFIEESTQPLSEICKVIELNKHTIDQIPSTWPVKKGLGYISMYFGLNNHPFFGSLYLHSGIDISVNGRTGDYIISTADGTVTETGYDVAYGNFITIKHGFNFFTRYAHLQKIMVKRGQKVSRGQDIGILGNTGLSTGPHVHYEIIINQKYIDPSSYMILKN